MRTAETAVAPAMPSGWRVKTGMVLFALVIVPYWALAPIVFRDLPLPTIATLTAAGAIMGKVFLVGAVMVLGKSAFAVLKAKLFHQLSRRRKWGRCAIGSASSCSSFRSWGAYSKPMPATSFRT